MVEKKIKNQLKLPNDKKQKKIYAFSSYKITLKHFFSIMCKNYFFILFAFFNLFMPLYSTIIAALRFPNGLLNVIAIGLSTSFITVFNQLLFLSSIALLFIFRREHLIDIYNDGYYEDSKKNDIILVMLIYSFVAMILFILSSMIYIDFSASYNNIVLSVKIANQFILTIAPTLLFNGMIYLCILYGLDNKRKLSIFYYLFFVALQLILIPCFYLWIKWPRNLASIGLGLGSLLSSMITFGLIMIVSAIIKVQKRGVHKEEFKIFFKKTNNFMWSLLLGTILKVFLIMIISISVGLGDKKTPISLITTKIIWYNSLFFCGFLADGVQNVIEYSRIKAVNEEIEQRASFGVWWTIAGIIGLLTIGVTAIFNVAAMNLGELYLSHQNVVIVDATPQSNPLYTNVVQQIKDYLWSPNTRAYNLELYKYNILDWYKQHPGLQPTPQQIEQIWYQSQTPCYALLYLTIYHFTISMVKVMTVSEIKFNQKFKWKSFLGNFITLVLIMTFISVFSIAFKQKGFIMVFQGVDAFSFSLMWVAIILLFLKVLPVILKPIMIKKYMKKMQLKQHAINVTP